MTYRCLAASIGFVLAVSATSSAAEVRVASAANLRGTLDRILQEYETARGVDDEISITFGSTGKLYAQIVHGAPFDLFFGADVEHARRLEEERLAISGSRFTYALGRLALWSREPLAGALHDRLLALDFDHLAIASPRVAPYGRAAREVLEATGLWDRVEPRLVYGEDVGQTFHFVETGAAELGFVPLALVLRSTLEGANWIVPAHLHAPIEQQAVRLTDAPAAHSFLEFIRGDHARSIFSEQGFEPPR